MKKKTKLKHDRLRGLISEWERCVVAFSGGCDSSLLLRVALDTLGKGNVLAVTAKSPTFPLHELNSAREQTAKLDVEHVEFDTEELNDPNFFNNPADRCYYCKRELFENVLRIAREKNFFVVADASNYDDEINDYRPGLLALKELGIRSPLKECQMTKAQVRELSKELGLSTYDKPSFACLASRFPYGEKITAGKLQRVDAAEQVLRETGFKQFRVRSHGEMARIELGSEEDTYKLLKNKVKILNKVKELGYTYITLDLEGYRSGSMNEAIGK